MYGLGEDVDLSPMFDKSIEQICIGQYQVALNLSEGLSVSIEAVFTIRNARGEAHEVRPDQSDTSHALLSLLGEKIVSAILQPPGGIDISFSNGSCLCLSDSNNEFESYSIDLGGRTLVV